MAIICEYKRDTFDSVDMLKQTRVSATITVDEDRKCIQICTFAASDPEAKHNAKQNITLDQEHLADLKRRIESLGI